RSDDVAIVTPASAESYARVAQRDRCTAFHCNLFQLAIGEEPDPIARRSKEWARGVLSTRQRRNLALTQEARVKAHLAVRAAQRDCQPRSVWGKGQHVPADSINSDAPGQRRVGRDLHVQSH